MTSLKKNILANFLGRGWSALMALAFVPFYIHFIGIEGYALIGFSLTLFSIASLLDLGVGTALNRELARRALDHGQAQTTRNLVRTLEVVYWPLALIIGIAIAATAPFIANHWIKAGALSSSTIEHSIQLMGIAFAFQWPMSLYSGGLLGLERQVQFNIVTATMSTVRGLGAVLVLWLIAPTAEAYFGWQIVVSAVQTIWCAAVLWKNLPQGSSPASFQWPLIVEIGGFAAGVSGISMLSVILTQLDKVLLSALLPLEVFGYYALAGLVASAATMPVAPIFTALLPRLSRAVKEQDSAALADLYHTSSQLVVAAMLPLATVVVFFAPEILLAWTRDTAVAANGAPLVVLITIGSILNALLNMPYALQLAYGWTRLTLLMTLCDAILLVPLIVIATDSYGAIGAAVIWVAMNGWNLLIGAYFMHRRILQSEGWRWASRDVLLPVAVALGIGILARLAFPAGASTIMTATWLALVAAAIGLACMAVAPSLRAYALQAVSRTPRSL